MVYGGPNEVAGPELDVETLEPAGGGDGSRGFQLLLFPVDTTFVTLDRATGGGDINNDGIDDIAVDRGTMMRLMSFTVVFGVSCCVRSGHLRPSMVAMARQASPS